MNEQEHQKVKQGKAALLRAVLLLAVIPLVLAGVSYAWMYNGMDIQTLLRMEPPSNIAILEPDQNKALDALKLEGSQDVERKDDGTVTLRRVFRVNSTGPFDLEIAHTTNLKGLQFRVYLAKTAEDTNNGYAAQAFSNSGKTYYYNNSSTDDELTALTGNYINQDAEKTSDYKFADNTLHDQVYYVDEKNSDNSDKVQAHAEPLYWLCTGTDETGIDKIGSWGGIGSGYLSSSKDYYFVLEASWTDIDKETDIFYILAQNHPTGSGTSGT